MTFAALGIGTVVSRSCDGRVLALARLVLHHVSHGAVRTLPAAVVIRQAGLTWPRKVLISVILITAS
jgi:hypothetical protein